MFRTTTVTELRAGLSACIDDLAEGPILVLAHSRPAAVLLDPGMFEALVEKIELLEDLVEGRKALAEYAQDSDVAVDAEEVFQRLGH